MCKKTLTLTELMVVMAIIAILSAVVVAQFHFYSLEKRKNYKICNIESCDYVDSYTKERNCVFLAEIEKRVCGDYTIKKINE